VVLLIIFNAVSSSADRVADAGSGLGRLLAFMILLHALVLAFHYALARTIRLDAPSVSAFTIHASQKTLTVSYLVWNAHFSVIHPLAMLPGIVYHLTQMVMDTAVARHFQRRAERARALGLDVRTAG
jgi:sodium/bile acid cotransporter 7